MKVSFVSQGLSEEGNSVGKIVLESFRDTTFNKFSCLVAFVSTTGIEGLEDTIIASKSHINQFNVIVGIDQKATSKESLERLLSLNINAKVYYTSSHIIFHPKIYIFDSETKCRIIIGSSNLTKAGLFQNVEASTLIDFDKPDAQGETILSEINTYFNGLFSSGIANINALSETLIGDLLQAHIIPDRAESEELRKARETISSSSTHTEAVEEIKRRFPPVSIQRVSSGFGRRTRPTPTPTTVPVATPTRSSGSPLWEKKLSKSDALQPPRAGTNPTGKLSLSQGMMRGIDQTKYFRETLFGTFTWTLVKRPSTEATEIRFKVKILGVDKGEYRLKLRHNPRLEAHQHNFTTSLSWGDLSNAIKAQNLTGKILRLYAPRRGTNEPFFIEIG